MTDTQIRSRLRVLNIREIPDVDVPINGTVQELPCYALLPKTTVIGSDNGSVGLHRTDWQMILLTAQRDDELNRGVLAALAGAGKVTVDLFPDLSPYQTTFKFTTFDL